MKGHRKEFRGLLYKDLMNLRSSCIVLAILFVILGLIFVPTGSYFALYIALMISASLLVVSTMSMDTEGKWNSFVLTTAVSRKEVVRSKYILMILISIITWIIGILLYVLFHALNIEGLTVTVILVTLATGLLHGLIMIPLKFRFDSPAMHYISVGLILLLAVIAAFPIHFMMDAVGTALYPIAVGIVSGLLTVSIIGFGISYLISQKIFAKKDF